MDTHPAPHAVEKLLLAKNKHWTKLHQFLHDRHGVRYFIMAIGIIVGTGIALLAVMYQRPVQQATETPVVTRVEPKPEPPKFYAPLSGAQTADEASTKRPVTAIMIENSPDARPQSGLKDAGIVYEAVAEGGITRFIALYQETRPGIIGPVRSVRPYYVEWAAAYDPAVAHIGGSARALQMIRGGGYGTDLDQFFNASTYWRAADRYAPHNVYTDFDHLDSLSAAKGKTTSAFTAWPRQDEAKLSAPVASQIDIAVSSGSYTVHYNYDAGANSYVRLQGGEPHLDREAGQISPKVVIALKVPIARGFEDGYREQIVTTGSGEGYVFQNGNVQTVTWRKASATAPLLLLDASGKEVPLNRGQTWVTALANTRNVTWQ